MEDNPSVSNETVSLHCYCSTAEIGQDMLTCKLCKKFFHLTCLKSGRPSPLMGDVYFTLTCENCSSEKGETVVRKKLQWTLVIMIALYNLQLQGGGKCGYFRWREHICRFIDKNWNVFFGDDKKRSATWHGTVAGALSTGANQFFTSGLEVLGENGWWSLKSTKLPTFEELAAMSLEIKAMRKKQLPCESDTYVMEGSRKKHQNVVEAAVALKEKKACIENETFPKMSKNISKKHKEKLKFNEATQFKHKIKLIVSRPGTSNSTNDVSLTIPKLIIKKESSPTSHDENFSNMWNEDTKLDLNSINLDVESGVPLDLFDNPSNLQSDMTADNAVSEDLNSEKITIKQEFDSDDENSNSNKQMYINRKHPDTSRKRKAVTREESPVKEISETNSKMQLMCMYEEEKLLQKLQHYQTTSNFELRRLYRKLKVRKLQREKNLPVFDIDAEMRAIRGMDPPEYTTSQNNTTSLVQNSNSVSSILDRYQSPLYVAKSKSQIQISFATRLIGFDEEDQNSIVSPYTERILKPFIFRDFKTKPLKLQLLQELILKTNKQSVECSTATQSSIDYCYVRPQHIPAVNAICQEFFWPGIDMSECLQYPDFSCIALYKKLIIGFAFMIPDVKYNEAYRTYIFCHPEWRRAGIATFMLYHLIQTCMGKDVTLHVSATSSAVFLYQKFGFKVEEFIHDFYDKYLPPESKECRHALFMRLSR